MGIRLVCSDLDGTLLQYGKKELEGEIFDQIRALHDKGILFCPASGRQYTSLRKMFAPVADCCIFLCENGGVIYKDEQYPHTGGRRDGRGIECIYQFAWGYLAVIYAILHCINNESENEVYEVSDQLRKCNVQSWQLG